MQKRNKKRVSDRILAAVLSLVLVMSMLPVQVSAATPEHPDSVTITVTDETGAPLTDVRVEYTVYSAQHVSDVHQGAEITDEYGAVEVLPSADYVEGDLTLSAVLSKDGYYTDSESFNGIAIEASDQDFPVTLKSIRVPGITATPASVTYDGGFHDAVIVNGVQEGDRVSYRLGEGDWTETVPQIREAGTYSVQVRVQRDGYDDYMETVEAEVKKASITLEAEPLNSVYNGRMQAAIEITGGIEPGDRVTYSLNDGEEQREIPRIENAGEYSVTVNVYRNENYESFTQTYTAVIEQANIEDLSADLYKGVYDGKSHAAVLAVRGLEKRDTVEYRMNGSEWSEDMPEVTDAGEYTVNIRVTRNDQNYRPTEIVEMNPMTVVVQQAEPSIAFKENHTETTVSFDAVNPENNKYDFSAVCDTFENPQITYKVENSSQDDPTPVEEIASIDENGQLTVFKGGYVILITATVSGDGKNYKDGSVEYELGILNEEDDLISFASAELAYTFGENNGIVADQQAEKKHNDDNGEISYSGTEADTGRNLDQLGISVDRNSGRVRISDYSRLVEALESGGGTVKIEITAHKEPGTKKSFWFWIPDKVIYDECDKTYTVEISFAASVENGYLLQDPDGVQLTAPNGTNGWYNTAVTAVPAIEGYRIAKDTPVSFGTSVVFDNQGTAERRIYLQNASGGISAPEVIPVEKIDSEKPDSSRITIEYSDPVSPFMKVLGRLFGFYKDEVEVTFTAYDETSGVDGFAWTYSREEGASISNLETAEGNVSAVQDEDDPAKYTAQITLPEEQAEQLRGYLSVNATDKAGLTSENMTDDGRIIVVDSVSPQCSVSFGLKDAGGTKQEYDGRHYFSDDVELSFSITEANFFAEDVRIWVSKENGETYQAEPEWTDGAAQDEHVAAYTLSGDGDYSVSMEYTDRSRNVMAAYQSPSIVIDTIDPVIEFDYADYTDRDHPQTAWITVTEHNFRAEDIEVLTDARDINGNPIQAEDLQQYLRTTEWTQDGDVHTAEISDEFVDAIYNLTLDYKDLALRSAEQVRSGEFIVDHTAPDLDAMDITYSTPITEKILSAVTFGFYNPSVEVTFTAEDPISGIDYFIWSYEKEEGASEINVSEYGDAKLEAEQDGTDKAVFTATVTLPKDEAEQLRGSLAFHATDKYNNVSQKLTDTDHVIIVDTIAPEMTAEFDTPSRIVGSNMYYNKDAGVSFTVTEANFYPEDVQVEISKDGGAFTKVTPEWTEVSADVHVGKYTVSAPSDHSGDGDYVIRVNYADRSNNRMETYTSDIITIDTIAPVISVSYLNRDVKNTLQDAAGNTRDYYDTVQTAVLTVKEHNFEASEVDLQIAAEDVSGSVLNADALHSKSSWSSAGDTHTITITYPGDANYTFDVAYADLATNEAADYSKDYFTVDTTAPANLSVSYSSSVLDTILEGITFGFYNARMTVTIQAEDDISGVHDFNYSYIKAAGVSMVNAELLDQLIDEAGISYSEDRSTAVTTFEIPRDMLTNNNQFNGNVEFTASDRSVNNTEYSASERIVVDNIAPTASVEYNSPVNTEDGISYYDGPINASLTVNEANFYPGDVNVTVTRDGAAYPVTPSWSDAGTDVHTGTFALTEDGDYVVTVTYSDKSGNAMSTYTSNQMTIDTEITDPVILINGEEGNGRAFKEDVVPSVSFSDINFDSYEIRLTRTRYNDIDADVTEQYIGGGVTVSAEGGTGSFDTFTREADTDGIYTLTVSMTDKAGHSAEAETVFTVNRFGSVYVYDNYLSSLIADGGAYVQEVDDDLIITEYNADKLVENSLDIAVSRDGRPVSEADYEVTPEINEQAAVGTSGWYQYRYVISKENFEEDGVYKVSVSSKDATGNSPETANYKDKDILFRVDSTAPEINSITGLEESIINASDVDVNYTLYDTIGLESVEVYLDGDKVDEVTDFSKDMNNYAGRFTVSERQSAQTVRLVVKDKAGNVTDTDSDDFESAYAFNRVVTVSTNFFVRFYANKTLFWGSIIVVVLAAGGITFIVLGKRKKGEKSE